ncbi:GTPase ObgE [Rhodoflexus sp.]
MSSPNFIDYVKIYCRSGAGGAGSVHFRREKYVPKGGPDGGDGGRGGHIILRGNAQLWTLLHLKYTKHLKAQNGAAGTGQNCSGKQGDDLIVEVPIGTIVRHAETGQKMAEIMQDGQEIILLRGGRGGLGNQHFATPTNQAPRYAQPGEPSEEAWVIMELKVLADVGLVGFPNAGKSTLLSVISAAKPEIADYPFTTTTPNLGVVRYRDGRSFVVADIPGIIEGAAEGKGLGLRFLRHIERNSVLLFMVPVDSKHIAKEYNILLNELRKYNPELLDKKRLLAVTKADLIDDELKEAMSRELPEGVPAVFISSVAQQGLQELKDMLWKAIQDENQPQEEFKTNLLKL